MFEKNSHEDDLFEEALRKASGPERAAFLEGACRNDHPENGTLINHKERRERRSRNIGRQMARS